MHTEACDFYLFFMRPKRIKLFRLQLVFCVMKNSIIEVSHAVNSKIALFSVHRPFYRAYNDIEFRKSSVKNLFYVLIIKGLSIPWCLMFD